MWLKGPKFIVDVDWYGDGGGENSLSIAGTARSALQDWDFGGMEWGAWIPHFLRNQGIVSDGSKVLFV